MVYPKQRSLSRRTIEKKGNNWIRGREQCELNHQWEETRSGQLNSLIQTEEGGSLQKAPSQPIVPGILLERHPVETCKGRRTRPRIWRVDGKSPMRAPHSTAVGKKHLETSRGQWFAAGHASPLPRTGGRFYLGSVGFPGCWHPKGIGRDAGISGMPVSGFRRISARLQRSRCSQDLVVEMETRWAPEAGRRLPASSHDVAPEEEAIFGGYVLGIVAQGALGRGAGPRQSVCEPVKPVGRRFTRLELGICHCNGPCCRTRDVEGNPRVRRVDWAGTSRSGFQVPWPPDWLNGRSATWCSGFNGLA